MILMGNLLRLHCVNVRAKRKQKISILNVSHESSIRSITNLMNPRYHQSPMNQSECAVSELMSVKSRPFQTMGVFDCYVTDPLLDDSVSPCLPQQFLRCEEAAVFNHDRSTVKRKRKKKSRYPHLKFP